MKSGWVVLISGPDTVGYQVPMPVVAWVGNREPLTSEFMRGSSPDFNLGLDGEAKQVFVRFVVR